MEEESAPKKQFRLKKKSFFIFLIVFILLVFVTAGVTYFLLRDREERLDLESEYKRFFEYCGEGDGDTIECKVLLGDFYDSEDGKKDCMEIVLPIADIETREVSLCFDKGVVEWENPYHDYSLHVPVLIQIEEYREISRVEDVRVALLEDEDTYALMEKINLPNTPHLGVMTKYLFDLDQKGFYLSESLTEDGEIASRYLVLRKARIEQYEISGGLLVLDLLVTTYGKVSAIEAVSEGFSYYDSEFPDGNFVDVENVEEVLNTNLSYDIFLTRVDREITEAFWEEYIESPDPGERFLVKVLFAHNEN